MPLGIVESVFVAVADACIIAILGTILVCTLPICCAFPPCGVPLWCCVFFIGIVTFADMWVYGILPILDAIKRRKPEESYLYRTV